MCAICECVSGSGSRLLGVTLCDVSFEIQHKDKKTQAQGYVFAYLYRTPHDSLDDTQNIPPGLSRIYESRQSKNRNFASCLGQNWMEYH